MVFQGSLIPTPSEVLVSLPLQGSGHPLDPRASSRVRPNNAASTPTRSVDSGSRRSPAKRAVSNRPSTWRFPKLSPSHAEAGVASLARIARSGIQSSGCPLAISGRVAWEPEPNCRPTTGRRAAAHPDHDGDCAYQETPAIWTIGLPDGKGRLSEAAVLCAGLASCGVQGVRHRDLVATCFAEDGECLSAKDCVTFVHDPRIRGRLSTKHAVPK